MGFKLETILYFPIRLKKKNEKCGNISKQNYVRKKFLL